MTKTVKKVVIVGAGPAGVLLAHYLLRRSDFYQVDIYERRSDPRIALFENSRTYPITLNKRGLSALGEISGLGAAVKTKGIEINGTISHKQTGLTRLLPRRKPLIALDRTKLVMELLEKLTENSYERQVNINFNCQCISVDFEAKTVVFRTVNKETSELAEKDFTISYDLLIGADGARSAVRQHFLNTELFEFEQKYVLADYKTVFLPCANETASIDLRPGYIHNWRLNDGTAVLAVPMPDGTVNGVIFFPRDKNQVVSLSTKEQVIEFFNHNFPDLSQIISELEAEAFLARPISTVLTIRCNRYHYYNSALLIGDAAHAVSPSLGQGCNSAFEDVVLLDSLLDEYSDSLEKVLPEFTVRRKPDVHALLELSESPFPLSKLLFIELLLRQRIARIMHQLFPNLYSPFLLELLSETTVPYAKILDLYKNWVAKVKKANQKFLTRL